MSTSSRPPAGARASAAAVLAALTVTGASLITAPAAVAAPGDPDVVIHKVGFPFDNQLNQPLVCDFYLSAVNFPIPPVDDREPRRVNWTIDRTSSAPATDPIATGVITLDRETGSGHSTPVTPENAARLPNGEYVLTWRTVGGTLEEGRRTINVSCPLAGPEGAVPAGAGGLAMPQDFGPVVGAAAVGLAAAGGVAYLRLRRRRADGAA